jgi:hypothetical protein
MKKKLLGNPDEQEGDPVDAEYGDGCFCCKRRKIGEFLKHF